MAEIRILRVLEYVGEEELVWENLKRAAVPLNGELDFRKGKGIQIKSGLIGYPDFMKGNIKQDSKSLKQALKDLINDWKISSGAFTDDSYLDRASDLENLLKVYEDENS